ncbi:hypothetical protein AAG906_037288 [Vitis piasezkii]
MRIALFSWLYFLPLCSIVFGIHVALVSGECLSDGSICLEDQMSLLLQLKNTLKFNVAASSKLVSWNPSMDCCSWGGVTWDATGHVVALDLSSQSIYGGFNNSSSIFSLQYLQSLNLADNTYSSQIPSGFDSIEISRLTKLVTIDFSVLYLPGVPTLKLESPNLRMLVQNLTELRELYLDGVNISAQGKEWCQALSSSLPNLQVLSLASCYLYGPLDSSLQKLRSLSSIRLDSNNFSAPVLEFLANFSNLTQLRLSSCGLKGTFPEKIFQVPTLQILDLSNNKLLLGSLPEFPQNGSLETLVLPDTKFSGKVPNSIGNLKRLTRIELARCNFSGPIPNSTANLAQLVYLDLSENKFSGPIPPFSLSKNLTRINLSHNYLTGPIPSSHCQVFSVLDTLDLSSNNLEGPIPVSVFDLHCLNILDLSSNKFNGTVELSSFQKLGNLSTLSLSYNFLSTNASVGNPTSPLLSNLTTLKLASCKLRTLPDLSTQSRLTHLDLSDNQIRGSIPNWIWKIGNGSLIYVDYSDNRFTSSIPDDIGVYISFTIFFSLSKNNITGSIPRSICNATYLQVLDFSDNNLSGKVPSCLIEYGTLGVLNLRRNHFSGAIPGKFPVNCLLQTLDLSGNRLEGKIPGSLASCTALEVLNLGNNQMNGTFPCLLKNITTMRVLVLRGNKFQGSIGCPKSNSTWAMLQIVDLAFNNFSGKLPAKSFSTWTAMMAGENEVQSKLKQLQSRVLQFGQLYYQDAVTVTSKGREMELVKVLTLFTSIDLSCNNFEGDIPEVMGTSHRSMFSTYRIIVSQAISHRQ